MRERERERDQLDGPRPTRSLTLLALLAGTKVQILTPAKAQRSLVARICNSNGLLFSTKVQKKNLIQTHAEEYRRANPLDGSSPTAAIMASVANATDAVQQRFNTGPNKGIFLIFFIRFYSRRRLCSRVSARDPTNVA